MTGLLGIDDRKCNYLTKFGTHIHVYTVAGSMPMCIRTALNSEYAGCMYGTCVVQDAALLMVLYVCTFMYMCSSRTLHFDSDVLHVHVLLYMYIYVLQDMT